MKLLSVASNAIALSLMAAGQTSAFQMARPAIPSVHRRTNALSMGSGGGAEPEKSNQHVVSIEYCTGCRWMLKSFWMAQELLMTFERTPDLSAVTIIPSRREDSGGIYKVTIDDEQVLWDRKQQGGFPSTKALKQLVRDLVAPDQFLGHSDTAERQEENAPSDKVEILPLPERSEEAKPPTSLSLDNAPKPAVTITYCTGCRWLLRAAYFGQELMTTFDDEINSVTLVPSKPPAKGGQFVSLRFVRVSFYELLLVCCREEFSSS